LPRHRPHHQCPRRLGYGRPQPMMYAR
jgi:hypothetical protein